MPGLSVTPLAQRVGVQAVGEVNVLNCDVWEHTLSGLPSSDTRMVHLDLAQLKSVDAGGIAAIAAIAQRLAPAGRVVLHDPPPALRRILQVMWPDTSGIEVRAS